MNKIIEEYNKITNDAAAYNYYSSSAQSNQGIVYKLHSTNVRKISTVKTYCDDFEKNIGVPRAKWSLSTMTGQEIDKQKVPLLLDIGAITTENGSEYYNTNYGVFVNNLSPDKENENWLILFLTLLNKTDIIETSNAIFATLKKYNIDINAVLPSLLSTITTKQSKDNNFYEFLTYETFYKEYKNYHLLEYFSNSTFKEKQEYYKAAGDLGVLNKKIAIVTVSTIADDALILYMYYYLVNTVEPITINNLINWYGKIFSEIDSDYIVNVFNNNKELFDFTLMEEERNRFINLIVDTIDNAIEREKKYKKWLLNEKKPKIENEALANSYISSMKLVFDEYGKFDNYNSIFDIDSAKVAGQYFDYITANDEYKTKYLADSNYVARTGFNLYIDFLNFVVIDCNIIFYGVPGVGKSHKIKQVCDEEGFVTERTVFHPEYTNADFVGQILPHQETGKTIEYKFAPGPFTRILGKALQAKQLNVEKKFMLVIDEINRGNAAAIFGEIFQLLDREDNGESKYEIDNEDIKKCLIKDYEIKEETFRNGKIYIPSNLYIWATMNTSDQNVFTLDTAFQRRWTMELIPIDFDKDNSCINQGNTIIACSKNNITWRQFVEAVNSKLQEENSTMMSTEDKRLGTFFAKKDEIEDKKKFVQKVIKYLWDDAFKLSREKAFDLSNYKTLEDISKAIIDYGIGIEDLLTGISFGSGSEGNEENVASDATNDSNIQIINSGNEQNLSNGQNNQTEQSDQGVQTS